MRLMPQSLRGRLLALSLIATVCALAVAAVAIGGILERFVTSTTDARLADRLIALEAAVRPDGTIDPALVQRFAARIADDEPWRIDTPRAHAGTLAAAFADDPHFAPAGLPRPGPPRPGPHGRRPAMLPDGVRPFDAPLSTGIQVHGLTADVPLSDGTATIVVTVPRRTIDQPIRSALVPLALSLLALGVALTLAAVIQLRIGLRPLDRLRQTVAAVRAGEEERVPADQPLELRPLASELNALLYQNAAALTNARGHVANLAHGLKTPLATLALELRARGRDPDGMLAVQVARIDGAIRHHLGRARADSAGGAHPRVALAPAVAGLVAALARIHANRAVATTSTIAPDLSVAVDPHDLDELLGNLLDNAWRFAASRVTIDATAHDRMVRITIADDGPGIAPALRDAAMQPGRRLDEAGDGHGFGLSIARELAELHGGALALAEAIGGGLAAMVELPAAGVS